MSSKDFTNDCQQKLDALNSKSPTKTLSIKVENMHRQPMKMLVDPKSPISTLKNTCLIRVSLPKHIFRFTYKKKPILDETATFEELGIKAGDILGFDRNFKYFDNYDILEGQHREGANCCKDPNCGRRSIMFDHHEKFYKTKIPFIQKHQCICAWFERCGEKPRVSKEDMDKFEKNPHQFIDHSYTEIERPILPD